MRILYVVNNYYAKGNGLSASAQRTVKYLREAGMDVRVLSGADENSDVLPDYVLPNWKVPVFDKLIRKHGYTFAAVDREVIQQAIDWAEIVHFEEPFVLEMAMVKMVRKAGRILTSTYHLHPENLFSSIHMRRSIILNCGMMALWKHSVFNKCRVIQSPTANAAERLKRWRFKPEVRVISNGMLPHEDIDENSPICASDSSDGTFTIVSTGRYSVEKDQVTLLKAMKYSKYADRIRLVLAGRGPIEKTLKKRAARLVDKGILKYEPDFGFHTLAELEDIYSIVMPGRDEEKAREAIDNLLDPLSNTLNEYISKIKRCFKLCIIDEELASNYIISGKRGESYRIALDPSLIILPHAVTGE